MFSKKDKKDKLDSDEEKKLTEEIVSIGRQSIKAYQRGEKSAWEVFTDFHNSIALEMTTAGKRTEEGKNRDASISVVSAKAYRTLEKELIEIVRIKEPEEAKILEQASKKAMQVDKDDKPNVTQVDKPPSRVPTPYSTIPSDAPEQTKPQPKPYGQIPSREQGQKMAEEWRTQGEKGVKQPTETGKKSIYGKIPTTFQPSNEAEESSDEEDDKIKQPEPTNWKINPMGEKK